MTGGGFAGGRLAVHLRQGAAELRLPPPRGAFLPVRRLLQPLAEFLLPLLLDRLDRVHRAGHHVLHGNAGRLLRLGFRLRSRLRFGLRFRRRRRGFRLGDGGRGFRRRLQKGIVQVQALRRGKVVPEGQIQLVLLRHPPCRRLRRLLRFRRGFLRGRVRFRFRQLLRLRLGAGAAEEAASGRGFDRRLLRQRLLRLRRFWLRLRLRFRQGLWRRGLAVRARLPLPAELRQNVVQVKARVLRKLNAQQKPLGVHQGGIYWFVVVVLINHMLCLISAQTGVWGRLYPPGLCRGTPTHPSLCRSASYSSTAAAADALRELMRPFMGMLTRKSQLSRTRRPIPSPSLPMTMAAGERRSAS